MEWDCANRRLFALGSRVKRKGLQLDESKHERSRRRPKIELVGFGLSFPILLPTHQLNSN